ncbi:hypothetical protein P3T36_003890 [Kitasatospora sp. MAP12-15]|uniref:hypothetical protein n=1 Tax=unclassified Kitasatospora TaxID=2633591 RepID=UPI002474C2C3|nr:hypothetical protein [Kitasatospora sp. MAP12-44]MDH6108466.1 hypothetical protein [Kitasatospora sp. MAP12-44]
MSATRNGDILSAGDYVVDRRSGTVLVVMERRAGVLYLRPAKGGIEITREPEQVRRADRAESLSGRLAGLNADSRRSAG